MITIGPELIFSFACVCCAVGSINYAVTNIQNKREREKYEKEAEKTERDFNIRLKHKDPILYSRKETLDSMYNAGKITRRGYVTKMDKILKYPNAQDVLKEMKMERKVKKVLENSRDWRNY